MSSIQTDYSHYLHTYEAYRLPTDSIPKTASYTYLVKNDTDFTNLILTEKSKKQMIADRQAYGEIAKQHMVEESEKGNAEIEKKANEDKLKAMTVFRELSKGEKVPAYDENKLLQYDSKMYKLAKMAQMIAQLREDEKQDTEDSLWDEEDRKEPSGGISPYEIGEEFEKEWGEFMKAQADSVVEVPADNVDVSAIKSFSSMGSGVYQAIFDTFL